MTSWVMKTDGTSRRGLYLLGSDDGVSFEPLQAVGAPWYMAAGGGAERDASLYRRPSDGRWFVVYGNTASGADAHSSFGLAYTDNLETPTFIKNVSVLGSVPGATRVWAPEWFVDSDGSVHIIVAISSVDHLGPFACYELHPTNAAMTTWSDPVAITGTGFPTYWIDATIIKVGATYHLFYSRFDIGGTESHWIEHATSASPFSGYTVVHDENDLGIGTPREGPTVLPRAGGGYRMYMDTADAAAGFLRYSESADLVTWSAVAALPVSPAPAIGRWAHPGPYVLP